MGAVWGSRKGYYTPGYGYSEDETGEYTNAYGQRVLTHSGIYNANGNLLPGKVLTAGGVKTIGSGNNSSPSLTVTREPVKREWAEYSPETGKLITPEERHAKEQQKIRSKMSAQRLLQLWRQGESLTDDEISKVQNYLTILKMDQAINGGGTSGGSYSGGGGGTSSSSSTTRNRYKKMSDGRIYDRQTRTYLT